MISMAGIRSVGLVIVLLAGLALYTWTMTSQNVGVSMDAVHRARPMKLNDSKVNRKLTSATSEKHTGVKKRRLPKCLVIGVRKGGTMALLTFLRLHPDIVTAEKEMHFFSNDEKYKKGLSYYRELMPPSYADQLTIEKTPSYFIEEKSPGRVRSMNSSVRMLLVVRDPITRLVSDYAMKKSKSAKRKFTYPSLESLLLDKQGNIDPDYRAVMISTYYKHFSNWLKYFPRQQIHIVDGENLVAEPFSEMSKIESFLGLRHVINKDMFTFNESKGFYCIKNDNNTECLAETKGRKHPDVDPKLLKKLSDFFRPKNKKFFDLIGREFDWQ